MTRMAGSGSKQKRWMFLGLTLFTVVCFGQAMAQGGVVLDGVGDDWDAAWQVATDGLDVFITDTGEHPHAPPTYARSGYDALALWAHYQAADDRWYFRIDVDGRGGDSDSQVGTASNLGVGTDGYDGGPLVVAPFQDRAGLGNSEAYKLGFQYQSGGLGLVAELGPGTTILPGVLSDLGGDVSGQGIYSTTVPGVVEFGLDREELFPDGSFHNQLWVSGQIGDNNDRVSDDQINAVWVVGLNLAAYCPEAPVLSGEEATFPLRYAIPAGAAQGVTDAKLTALVPADTTFVSASDGGTESGGVITWDLGDLAPGDTGQVFFTLHIETSLTTIVIESEMSCAEGLRHQAANQCSVQQPTPTNTPTPTLTGTPTNTPTPSQTPTPSPTRPTNTPTATATATATATPTTTPTPRITGTPKPSPGPSDTPIVPEPATVSLVLTGMAGLAGYVLIQARGRRK